VILLTRFCKLLTRVATPSGGGARASSASMARRHWTPSRRRRHRDCEVWSKRRQTKTATSQNDYMKTATGKTATRQHGSKPKRRQNVIRWENV